MYTSRRIGFVFYRRRWVLIDSEFGIINVRVLDYVDIVNLDK